MAESKVLALTKEVEDLKRKLREVSHEKVLAINRCNEEWESKLSHQANLASKRREINKQQEMSSLETDVKILKDREITEKLAAKNFEIKKLKEQFSKFINLIYFPNIFRKRTRHNRYSSKKSGHFHIWT